MKEFLERRGYNNIYLMNVEERAIFYADLIIELIQKQEVKTDFTKQAHAILMMLPEFWVL